MTAKFDPRITPARHDLAAKFLEGQVSAGHFVDATPAQVIKDGANLHFSPSGTSRLESQLRLGEIFNVYELLEDWCWGQNETDGYVGYVARSALNTDLETPTDWIVTPFSTLHSDPDLKSPALGQISLGAKVRVLNQENGFSNIGGGSWLFSRHLGSLDKIETDYVATAMSLLGVPYLWGGRSGFGLDCSALVQLALDRAGIPAPRDSDLQEQSLGHSVGDGGELNLLQEGDLVFFPGHVGIALEEFRILHANAHDLMVSIHRLSEVLDRAKANNENFTSIRRIYAGDPLEQD